MLYVNCKKCGNRTENRFKGYCESCYNYYRKGGTDNPLPPKGIVAYDPNGRVICHICGQAFFKLGQHTYNKHKLTTKEYKERFEICNSTHLTEITYAKKMSNLAYKYNMPEQLRITGINTRVKPGETRLRLGKKVRLQERIAKKNRSK